MAILTKEAKRGRDRLVANHPCLGHAPNKGRLHLPVSPASNIKCRFCTRSFNAEEMRPGVARTVIGVDEAVGLVDKAIELCPEITVAGVAGPGDSLASGHALEALEKIRVIHPELIGCISTNGLALPDRAEAIARAGVGSVTVTVNAVDPEIQAQIIEFIIYDGRLIRGVEAATILIEHQLEGIRKVADLGVFVKVNTVLIPEINGHHIGTVSETVRDAGASIINIIPLIPQGDFIGMREPDCDELSGAREAVGDGIDVFRHCQHCRADACGQLGKDVSSELYDNVSSGNTFSHG